jgi:hypothetical protein
MKRDIVNQLTKLSQKAWEDYVKLPTNENREKFERIDDDLRVELEFDRTVKFNSNMLNDNIDTNISLLNG